MKRGTLRDVRPEQPRARRGQKKTGDPMRKIEPLSGFLRPERIRCGKPSCRCAQGQLHGPYFYHRWREGGRQHRRYVKPAEVEQVREALAEWRRLHPPADAMRRQLAELRRLLREFDPLEM